MKSMLVLLALVMSSQVLACPNLHGQWRCHYQDENQDESEVVFSFEQDGSNFLLQTQNDSVRFTAGAGFTPITFEDNGRTVDGFQIGYCYQDTVSYAGVIPDNEHGDDVYLAVKNYGFITDGEKLWGQGYITLFDRNEVFQYECERL